MRMRHLCSTASAGVLAGLFNPCLAAAQDAPPTPPTAETSGPAQPTAPTAENRIILSAQSPSGISTIRKYHFHEGGYFRANVGYGWSFAKYAIDDRKVDISGSGLATDLFAGWSPSPSYVLGGALLSQWAPASESESAAGTETGAAGEILVGPFVDGFPSPSGGFHLGATAGLASRIHSNMETESGFGFGAGAWLGLAGWVAPELSLGGLFRLTATQTFHDAEDAQSVRIGGFSAVLAFSVLYH